MSNVSNRHTVSLFVAGKSQALTGQRLSKVGFKLTQKMKDAGITEVPKSICVSLPQFEDSDIDPQYLSALMPHIKGILYKAQDEIIAAEYEKRGKDFVGESISGEKIDIPACIEKLEESETGGRLTVELLQRWFDENISAALADFLRPKAAAKFPDSAQCAVVVKNATAKYRDQISAMSGGATHYSEGVRKELEMLLGLVSDEGMPVAEKLLKRLEAMDRKDKKDALALGVSVLDF